MAHEKKQREERERERKRHVFLDMVVGFRFLFRTPRLHPPMSNTNVRIFVVAYYTECPGTIGQGDDTTPRRKNKNNFPSVLSDFEKIIIKSQFKIQQYEN